MNYEEAKSFLAAQGQSHVLAHWDRLTDEQKQSLLAQVAGLDGEALAAMKAQLVLQAQGGAAASHAASVPVDAEAPDAGARALARQAGEDAIRRGHVGVILVAGGQGTRLGYDGPKGAFSLAPLSNASLFEIHARKILALERKFASRIPFYLMTSEANDGATRSFFARHGNFGLDAGRVHFFVQGMWPALWPDGRIVLEQPGRLFMGPDGHGGLLAALRHSGMLADMRRRGLKALFYFQVDNPLVEIADPVLIGLHLARDAEMSLKLCAKRSPDEGLGVIVRRGDRYALVEYTELTEAQKHARRPDGRLQFLFGSVAIHVFSLDFLAREAHVELPLHTAHKKVPFADESGRTISPKAPNAFKFEKFIFDVLLDARRVLNLEFARDEEFSPVKNGDGHDSPATARRDLVRKYARWLEACGVTVPRDEAGEPLHRIEIDPCYALGPDDLRARLPHGFKVQGDLLLR